MVEKSLREHLPFLNVLLPESLPKRWAAAKGVIDGLSIAGGIASFQYLHNGALAGFLIGIVGATTLLAHAAADERRNLIE